MQFLRVTTLTNEVCRTRVPLWQRFIYDGVLCTSARDRQGACDRDAGGSLIANGQLIGVVSWNLICSMRFPDGFSRISYFANWIREVSGVTAV